MIRAVFLDRDGVIDKAIVKDGKPYPPSGISQLIIPPGVPDALRQLRSAGFRLLVITNQPDVARGKQKRENVQQMNAWLKSRLPLDEFYTCYHDDTDNCSCRKPSPGLILEAAKQLGVDLTQSFMIGDRWRDMEAAHRAGCRAVFIDYHYAERQPDRVDARVDSPVQAVNWILSQI